ncbi:MAG TPA: hypothetical protein VM754_08245 [Actinomycetota bacterium]|nr:hypothetical protein [Actinomycetota bacterium]
MTRRQDPIDARFEHLLREQVASSAPDPMSTLVRDLRRAYVAPFPMETQNRQIADMVIAGRQAAPTRRSPVRRRVDGVWYRFSQRFIATSVVGKVILAASVATAATGGMAATGHLPDPMQIAISAAASHVGVSIPAPGAPSSRVTGPPEPPVPQGPGPLQVPVAGPSPAPAPTTAAAPRSQPSPTALPADACEQARSASQVPPPPGTQDDVLKSLQHMTDEQLELDELLQCLVPADPAAPAPPGGGDPSAGLEGLLRILLGGGR